MNWKISDRILANDNRKKKEASAMSSAATLTPDTPAIYVRKMVEMESRGNGDQMNAIERVGRDIQMSARSVRRLLSGETDPTLTVWSRIHKAYIDKCARMAAALIHQIEIERARLGSEHFEDLSAEAQALAAKIQARKERIR